MIMAQNNIKHPENKRDPFTSSIQAHSFFRKFAILKNQERDWHYDEFIRFHEMDDMELFCKFLENKITLNQWYGLNSLITKKTNEI